MFFLRGRFPAKVVKTMFQQKWVIILLIAALLVIVFFFFGQAIIGFFAGTISKIVGLIVVAIGAVFGLSRRKK